VGSPIAAGRTRAETLGGTSHMNDRSTTAPERRGRIGRRGAAVAAALLLAVAALLVAPTTAGAAPADDGGVRVVHGVRGLVADVYLDGSLVLETFQPERNTEPLRVPAGDHEVEVRSAGAATTDAPLLTGTLQVTAGEVISAVVHLDADGDPALTQYTDDDTAIPAGRTRVVVRHVAAAPPIDVRLDGDALTEDLANAEEGAKEVPAGSHEVSVTQTGTSTEITPAQDVPFAEGTATAMYLIGDQEAGTLGWLAVPVTGLQSVPTKVRTGDSGLAAPSGGATPWTAVTLAGLVAVLLASVAGRRAARTA
jgi:hypothetical protein